MAILEQLKTILEADDFWQQENCKSFGIDGGILVKMTPESGRCGWKVTWPDRPETNSNQTFQYWRDAKKDLRAYLTRELAASADEASQPAKCEMHPT